MKISYINVVVDKVIGEEKPACRKVSKIPGTGLFISIADVFLSNLMLRKLRNQSRPKIAPL